MTTEHYPRKLAAVLSADAVGYSRLMGDDETMTVRTITAYREVIGHLIVQHRGRMVDAPGDNILAEFASLVDSVQCAVAVQKELQARNADLPEKRRMPFRIGINLGDVIEEGERLYGDGVNIAARLESLADPGGICISTTAFLHIESKLPLGYEYLGEQTVKNIAKPVGAYRVVMEPRVSVVGAGDKKAPSRKTWVHLVIAVVVILLAAAAYWQFFTKPTPPPVENADLNKMTYPLPDKPSIAVLPFTNMSEDSTQEYLADGITENIINALSRVPKIFVIARNSTFTYKGKPVKVQQVAEEMGVRYVLEGSIQGSRDRVRILVQLVDAIKGVHLWSERYDKDVKDIFGLQDDIAQKTMTALQVKLTEGEYASEIAGTTSNLQALECFWRAGEHFYRFRNEDNAAAVQWTQKAVELDPKFAHAWALMGWCYLNNVNFGWTESPHEAMEKASDCARKAIQANDKCANAYSLMGMINLQKKMYDKAIENGKEGVRLNPNDAMNLFTLACIMHYCGNFDESIAMVKNSMRLSPYYNAIFLRILSRSCFLAGRYEEALSASQLLLGRAHKGEFSPLLAHMHLAETYIGLGQVDKARALAAEVLKINPNFSLADERKRFDFYRNPAHLELIVDALRRAGLPDKPEIPVPATAGAQASAHMAQPAPSPAAQPSPVEKTVMTKPDKPSIAVLPFKNISGDPEQEYFSDGMTEELIGALAKLEGLKVISRTSAFYFKGKDVDLRTVGEKLGVNHVLEGSVRKSGNNLRIAAQLIRVSDDSHLWTETYDRELKEIFSVQAEISQMVVVKLKAKLLGGNAAIPATTSTGPTEAYDLVLKGRYFRYQFSPEARQKAFDYIDKAIEIAPYFAPAYLELALWNRDALSAAGGSISKEASRSNIFSYLSKAIELDGNLADAYAVLGSMKAQYLYDWKGAEDNLKRAIELNPTSPLVHFSYGTYLRAKGDNEEALSAMKKALELDPLAPYSQAAFGTTLIILGRYDEAIAHLYHTMEMFPKSAMSYWLMGGAYMAKGMNDEAIMFQIKGLEIRPNLPGLMGDLGVAYARAGRVEEAQSILNTLLEPGKKVNIPAFHVASIYNALGDTDRTFEYLEKAVVLKDDSPIFDIKSHPLFLNLHADPRFDALLKKMGLTD